MFSTSFSSFSKNMLYTLCYLIEFKLRKTFFFVIILVIVCSCNTKIFGISFALAYNAESSAIAVSFFVFVFFLRLHVTQKLLQLPLFFSFFFSILAVFLDGLVKVFLSVFSLPLLKTRVTSIGLVSLDTLANVLILAIVICMWNVSC